MGQVMIQWSGRHSTLLGRAKANDSAHTVNVEFDDKEKGSKSYFCGQVRMVTFGSEQYVWHSAGRQSHADADGPPRRATLPGGPDARFVLPKASVTMLRGKVILMKAKG